MLIWAGLLFLVIGVACLTIDRRAAHLFYDHINEPFFVFLDRTTHWAKGGLWLTVAMVTYAGSQIAMHALPGQPTLHVAAKASLAFMACLAAGSAVLHAVKRVLARRRPRDEMEMGLYGFIPFSFESQYNSFPSGHALTIMCVAVVTGCFVPHLAWLWFSLALWLGLTRAFLTAHFLSDVFVGAGIGLLAARETMLYLFSALVPAWF
jgi:membrane-associated phospholipid phosphatase